MPQLLSKNAFLAALLLLAMAGYVALFETAAVQHNGIKRHLYPRE